MTDSSNLSWDDFREIAEYIQMSTLAQGGRFCCFLNEDSGVGVMGSDPLISVSFSGTQVCVYDPSLLIDHTELIDDCGGSAYAMASKIMKLTRHLVENAPSPPVFFSLGTTHVWEPLRFPCFQLVHNLEGPIDGLVFVPGRYAVFTGGCVVDFGLGADVDAWRERESNVYREASRISADEHLTRSHDEFVTAVEEIKERIRRGDTYQTVLSVGAEVAVGDITQAVPNLFATGTRPYSFCFIDGDWVLVGGSPETFVEVRDGSAWMEPLAGTREVGGTFTEKEMAEHVMLVDLCRNDLSQSCDPGTIVCDILLEEIAFGEVVHMHSRVTGRVRGNHDGWSVLASASPAGTMVGAPKFSACELLLELEGESRGVYSGPIGVVLEPGWVTSALFIRSATIRDGVAYVRAGAGITADSDPDAEWKEVLLKLRAPIQGLRQLRGRSKRDKHGDNARSNDGSVEPQ